MAVQRQWSLNASCFIVDGRSSAHYGRPTVSKADTLLRRRRRSACESETPSEKDNRRPRRVRSPASLVLRAVLYNCKLHLAPARGHGNGRGSTKDSGERTVARKLDCRAASDRPNIPRNDRPPNVIAIAATSFTGRDPQYGEWIWGRAVNPEINAVHD